MDKFRIDLSIEGIDIETLRTRLCEAYIVSTTTIEKWMTIALIFEALSISMES